MIVKVHKIHWDARWTKSRESIDFTVTDVDCFVTKVSHPCAKWAIGEAWHRVCNWFQKRHATVILGEPKEVKEKKTKNKK